MIPLKTAVGQRRAWARFDFSRFGCIRRGRGGVEPTAGSFQEALEGARQDGAPSLWCGQLLRIFDQASQEHRDRCERLGGWLSLCM